MLCISRYGLTGIPHDDGLCFVFRWDLQGFLRVNPRGSSFVEALASFKQNKRILVPPSVSVWSALDALHGSVDKLAISGDNNRNSFGASGSRKGLGINHFSGTTVASLIRPPRNVNRTKDANKHVKQETHTHNNDKRERRKVRRPISQPDQICHAGARGALLGQSGDPFRRCDQSLEVEKPVQLQTCAHHVFLGGGRDSFRGRHRSIKV